MVVVMRASLQGLLEDSQKLSGCTCSHQQACTWLGGEPPTQDCIAVEAVLVPLASFMFKQDKDAL